MIIETDIAAWLLVEDDSVCRTRLTTLPPAEQISSLCEVLEVLERHPKGAPKFSQSNSG